MKFEIDRNKLDKALKNGFENMLRAIICGFGATALMLITFVVIYLILTLMEKCGVWYGISIGIIIIGIIFGFVTFIFCLIEDFLGW